MTKLICKENHWKVKDGQLILDTPQGQDAVKDVVRVLEKQIRAKIYEDICAIDLTDNRKQIIKNGIDNSLLTVQDLCAQIALGAKND
jgi:hypothetical protein